MFITTHQFTNDTFCPVSGNRISLSFRNNRRITVILFREVFNTDRFSAFKKAVLTNFFCHRGINTEMHTCYRSEEVRTFLPFLLRRAKILRPLFVDILCLKPCLLTFFLFDGWNVRFMNYSSEEVYFCSLILRNNIHLELYNINNIKSNCQDFKPLGIFLYIFSVMSLKYNKWNQNETWCHRCI